MFPALPTGMARMSGARPSSSQTSKAPVCWPVEAERVDRVDEGHGVVVLLGERPHDGQRLVEVAVDGHDPRPGHQRLEELALGDLPARQHDDDLHPGRRAVGRRGRGGVPRRGAHDRAGARLERLGDGKDHPAVLERAGRVHALELEVEVRDADGRAEPGGVDERRAALAEGEPRGRVGDGQERPVAVHQARPGRARAALQASCQSSIG